MHYRIVQDRGAGVSYVVNYRTEPEALEELSGKQGTLKMQE